MRQITKNSINAFLNRQPFSESNMIVETDELSTRLLLHGNCIAELLPDGRLFISNCGLQTNTKKERLNALPGVNITERSGKWHLNNEEWNGERKEILAEILETN